MQLIKKIIPYFKIGLLFLFVVTYFRAGIQELSQARQLDNRDEAFFTQWEKRFEPIKASLPFKYGVVGYVADWDIPGVHYDPADTEAEHVLTQYTMTPIVVSRNINHEWVIVNLNADYFDTWFAMHRGEYSVTKFNLYLLHRTK